MLTVEGRALIAPLLGTVVQGGRIGVSDGEQTAEAEIISADVVKDEVILRASFGPDDANFEWKVRTVVASDGTVIDTEEEDLGRKAAGTLANVEARIQIGG